MSSEIGDHALAERSARQALLALRAVLERDRDRVDAWTGMATLLPPKGSYEESPAAVGEGPERDPANADARTLRDLLRQAMQPDALCLRRR